jgi:L-malate glycosyltransferase
MGGNQRSAALVKVLLVSHTYTATANRAKLAALARLVRLNVVVPARWRDALFELRAETSAEDGYHLHALPARLDGRILRHWYPPARLARLTAEVAPDLVYVEEEPASLALAQMALLKRRSGYKLACFTWENTARRAGVPGVMRYNLARCDGLVAGNKAAVEVIRSNGYGGPCTILPQLGVSAAVVPPEPAADLRRRLGPANFVVGYAGRLTAEKGLHTLLEAVHGLPDAQLLLVGGGPLEADLQAVERQPDWAGRLTRVGPVAHEAVSSFLRAMDVCVLPSLTTSRWKEQFGHVLIEAMACGVPVIGSDSGAIPEVVGEAGLIFAEGRADHLRHALQDLQQDANKRKRLGQAGQARVSERYTHEHIAASCVAFFRQLLGRG